MTDNPLVIFDLERVLHQERRRARLGHVLADRPCGEVPRSTPTVPTPLGTGDAA